MKENKFNIEEEIEKTMNSLDRSARLEGDSWLYTRIKQRVSECEKQKKSGAFSLAQLQPLLFAGLLFINVWAAYTVFNNSSYDEDYLEELAAEYSAGNDQLMDYFTEE